MFCTNGDEIAEITTRNARQLYGLMWCASVVLMYIVLNWWNVYNAYFCIYVGDKFVTIRCCHWYAIYLSMWAMDYHHVMYFLSWNINTWDCDTEGLICLILGYLSFTMIVIDPLQQWSTITSAKYSWDWIRG
jgi:hypothetical protein